MARFKSGEKVWGRMETGQIIPIIIRELHQSGSKMVYRAEIESEEQTGILYTFPERNIRRSNTDF